MASLSEEIIFHILAFTNPLAIVLGVRLVSKRFRELTYDPELWKVLYRTAALPRPPSPYPSQSLQFLERTLVHSARLAEFWTTQPFQITLKGILAVLDEHHQPMNIICDRWLITCNSFLNMRIETYDIEKPPSGILHWLLGPLFGLIGRPMTIWE